MSDRLYAHGTVQEPDTRLYIRHMLLMANANNARRYRCCPIDLRSALEQIQSCKRTSAPEYTVCCLPNTCGLCHVG